MSVSFFQVQGAWPGQLSIVARPRGGEWLEREVQSWTRSGLEVVVSLLEPAEEVEFGLTDEGRVSRSSGITFRSFPIKDRGVPASRDEALKLVRELEQYLIAGKSVGIHCRQGIGRSGLIAACLLVSVGQTPNNAFKRISRARGCEVPETEEQREWVEAFAPQLGAARP